MAANEKLSIRFEAVGAKNLQNAINAIALASDRLMLSTRKYNKALAQLNHNQSKQVSKMFDIQTATRNTGNAFSVLRSKMLLVSFAFLVVGNSIGRLLKASGDLEEMMNKATVVFGKQIDVVTKWADALGNAIGRATSEIVGMATVLQDTFVPLGFTREAATQLSTSLTRLAIDVASFNNQADDQVIKDFQSAIVGNHMTVRKYGIVINQSTLKLEALNMGLIKGNQQLTSQQKVLARLNIIRKGSADADNDAMNTSHSFMNQLKALNAELLESAEFFGGAAKAVVTFGFQLGNAHISLLGITRQLARKEVIMSFGAAIATVGGFMLYTGRATWKTLGIMKALGNFMTKSNIALFAFTTLLTALGTIMQTFAFGTSDAKDEVESYEEAMRKAAESAGLLQEGQDGYAQSIAKSVAQLQKKINTLQATTEIEKYQAEITHEITDAEIELLAELHKVNEEYKIRQDALAAVQDFEKKDTKSQLERELRKKKVQEEERDFHLLKMAMNDRTLGALDKELAAKVLIAFNEDKRLKKTKDYTKQLELQNGALEETNKKIFDLNEELFEGTPLTRLSNAFSSELTLVADELENWETLMGSFVQSAFFAAEDIEDAWVGFGETVVSQMTAMAQANSDANIKIHKDNAAADIKRLKATRLYQKASAAQKEKLEQEQRDKHNDRIKDEFKNQKMASKASVTMDFAKAVMKSAGEAPFAAPAYYGVLAAMYLAQLELINSAKAPVMQYGGLVGGKSHGQGGTMIEAERGEYIVSKNAVESVGLETLNKINTGQGTGGNTINVSFEGNVLSQDFIEDEAIPQIKEAIRRGADIGLG